MVEGPTARAYAIKMWRFFKGEAATALFTRSKRILVPPKSFLGRRLTGVETIGKNILLCFNELAIRVHLLLFGSVHLQMKDEKLLKEESKVRLLVESKRKKLVFYDAPIVELGTYTLIKEKLSWLGPDPLREDWDEREAIRRIKSMGKEKIGVVLLNQGVIAGLGNILRNEILFRAGVHPERRVEELSERDIARIVRLSRELSELFLERKLAGKRLKPVLLAYNNFSRCLKCGNKMVFYLQAPIKRKTFFCPNCQT